MSSRIEPCDTHGNARAPHASGLKQNRHAQSTQAHRQTDTRTDTCTHAHAQTRTHTRARGREKEREREREREGERKREREREGGAPTMMTAMTRSRSSMVGPRAGLTPCASSSTTLAPSDAGAGG